MVAAAHLTFLKEQIFRTKFRNFVVQEKRYKELPYNSGNSNWVVDDLIGTDDVHLIPRVNEV